MNLFNLLQDGHHHPQTENLPLRSAKKIGLPNMALIRNMVLCGFDHRMSDEFAFQYPIRFRSSVLDGMPEQSLMTAGPDGSGLRVIDSLDPVG